MPIGSTSSRVVNGVRKVKTEYHLFSFEHIKELNWIENRLWERKLMDAEVEDRSVFKLPKTLPPFRAKYIIQHYRGSFAVWEGRTYDCRPIRIVFSNKRYKFSIGKPLSTVESSMNYKGWEFEYECPSQYATTTFFNYVEELSECFIDWSEAKILAYLPEGATY